VISSRAPSSIADGYNRVLNIIGFRIDGTKTRRFYDDCFSFVRGHVFR